MTETAITWQRVSTDAQETVNQAADIAGHVAAKGYDVARAFEISGASAYHGKQQADLDEMIAAIRETGATVVVVWHSDRLERRGGRELLNLLARIKEAGARVESVKEPELGAASMGGQIITFLGGLMAHAESAHKSDRIKAKQAHLRSIGSWTNGRAPFATEIVALPDGRKTIKPTADAATVVRVFEMTAAGMSYGQIARLFRAEGLAAPGGGSVWQEAVIGQIVRNPVFRGIVNGPDGRPYMSVEPIVSADLWLRANADVKSRSASKGHARRNKGGRPTLTLIRPVCAECEGPMYRYGVSYRCAGVGPTGNSAGRKGCGNTIKHEQLDAEVIDYFSGSDELETTRTVVAGTDHSEEIAAVRLAIKDLDEMSDTYDDDHAALMAQLRELRALPVEPERVEEIETGRTEGDAFADLDPAGMAAWLKAHHIIRVWSAEIVSHDGAARRWHAGYIGGLSAAESKRLLAAKLDALKG